MKRIQILIILTLFGIQLLGQENKIEKTGNVGIGTTTPDGKLHIKGGLAIQSPYFVFDNRGNVNERAGIMFGSNHPVNNSMFWISPDKDQGNQLNIGTGFSYNDASSLLTLRYNGYLGIGTVSPQGKLHVKGGIAIQNPTLSLDNLTDATGRSGIIFGTNNAEHRSMFWISPDAVIGDRLNIGTGANYNDTNSLLTLLSNGYMGVGVANPTQKLHINGNVQLDLPVVYAPSKSFMIFGDGNDHVIQGQAWTGDRNLNVKTRIRFNQQGIELQVPETFNSFEESTSFITGIFLSTGYYGSEKGNVGIGNSSPQAKLDVTGTIKAHEIQVTLASADSMHLNGALSAENIRIKTNGQTADFVFADDYQLRELEEVAQYVKENNHLPDIPSAEEMEKEGVDLAEMNKLLLQKIEELTLYSIKQNENIASKEKELGLLRNDLDDLRSQLNTLAKIIQKN